MSIKSWVLWAAALAAGAAGAASGNCEKNAKSLSASQAVTLVAYYDSDEKEYWEDFGVAYYKIKLSKGSAATIWIAGGNAAELDLSVDTDWDSESLVGFDSAESFSGGVQACYLHADYWDEDDPSSETFYVCVSGEIGQKTTLNYVKSIKTFTVAGEENSPISLTMKTTEQTYGGALVTEGGETWFKAKLVAGAAYAVRTLKGAAGAELGIDFESTTLDTVEDYAYAVSNTNNAKYWIYPEKTGTYKFTVGGGQGQKYQLKYMRIPARTPAQHPFQELAASNSYAAAMLPGRLNATRSYYDAIPDESLARISLAKGQRVAFETAGATAPIRLAVFSAAGAELVSNESLGKSANDCRAALVAPSAGYYYVGVYDPNLEPEDDPGDALVTLTTVFCDDAAPADDWDPADDVAAGASALVAAPTDGGTNIFAAAASVCHGPHAFDVGDWYDVYALACRKGVTYRLRAAFADEEDVTDLTLAAKVFTLSKSKEVAVSAAGTLLSDDDAGALTFTATANGTVYVRVWVAEGVGLDFPGHYLYAGAYKTGGVGWLKVRTKGAEGTWSLGSESVKYANGAVVNVAGSQKVVFSAVSGFATPASVTTNVVVGVGEGAALVQVTGIYNDAYDRYQVKRGKKTVWVSDDDADGAVALSLSKTAKTYPRTLWTGDPRDLFTFTARAGVWYDFELVDTTLDGEGDAVFEVVDAGGEVVAGPTTNISKTQFEAGAHVLRVVHADALAPADTSYRLVAASHDAGTVKFKQAAYTVSENAAYVTLTLVRSAAEGALRVRWATAAGTDEDVRLNAQPGRDYYPADGVVSWADGDKKDKTVQVRLIPDLQPVRDCNRSFTVNLAAMEADDLEDGEYLAQLAGASAKVTRVEATAAAAGTVSVPCYGDDDTPVSSVKKPIVYATAGGYATFTLRRASFTPDTRIAVRAVAVSNAKKYKDTAKAGTDFDSFDDIFVWEAGDGEDKEVSVSLPASSDLTVSKQFTVTLTALTKDDCGEACAKASLAAAAVTVKIANDTAEKAFSTVAKEMKTDGIAATAKGTWYGEADGTLSCAEAKTASLTLQLTGPGLLVVDPTVDGDGVLTCKVGGGAVFECAKGRLVQIVPSGKQNVVFTLKDDDGASVSFAPLDDEKPYKWVPFSQVKPVDPYYSANVATDWPSLSWSVPEAFDGENMRYRVRFGNAKSPTALLTNATASTACEIPAGTLTAGKTWYWALDYACPADGSAEVEDLVWTAGSAVWSFTTASAAAQETKVVGIDTYGKDYYDCITNDVPIELVVGVKVDFEIGPSEGDSVKSRVVSGSLPPGLTLNGAAKAGTVSGTPTKAGVYTALLQTATGTAKKPVWATTQRLTFNVTALGSAAGTFRGALREEAAALETGAPRLGFITFTASAAGKLSASVKVAGRTYAFSGTGYDEVVSRDDDDESASKQLSVTLTQTSTYGKVKYQSELVVTLDDGDVPEDYAEGGATARLHLYVPTANGKALAGEADYACTLRRAPTASDTLAAYAGYYTAALVAPGVAAEDGVPAGHGFLTLTVSEAGAVKVGGRLADGTSVSASTVGTLVGDPCDPSGDCGMVIPLVANTTTYAFGGELRLLWSEEATVVDSAAALAWYKDGTTATQAGEALALEVLPAGGYYDKVSNLQTYYLNRDFTLDGIEVLLQGNAVKLGGTTGETASAITYALTRATGLATGTLTYAGTKKIAHYGVLTMNRAADSPLGDDVWAAGFFLHKVSKTWTESLPFDLLMSPDELDRDWGEADLTDGEAE